MRKIRAILYLAAALLSVAACGTRNGKKTNSEAKADAQVAEEVETCLTAIDRYLSEVIGAQYASGEVCIPCSVIMDVKDSDDGETLVSGSFWVFNYVRSGDTLKTVSGGNHSGCMTLRKQNGTVRVTGFVQASDGAGYDASVKRIFGDFYDIYQNMHSNQDVREAVRQEQLTEYVNRYNLDIHYYYDYGWDAVGL